MVTDIDVEVSDMRLEVGDLSKRTNCGVPGYGVRGKI